MAISREEAIALAKGVARQHHWVWTGEIQATFHRRVPVLGWLFGRHPVWRVISNADDVGYNVMVTIDAVTRAVLKQRFGPR